MSSLDHALLALADGDRSRFDEVYRWAWPRVRALCRRLLQEDAAAEDVAQQALLKVFEKADQFDPTKGSALAWIHGVAAWEVKTHRRRQSRRRETHEWPQHQAPGDLEADALTRNLMEAIRAEIGHLSPLDQATLQQLLDGEGSGPTFRKRLQRALNRLRASFGNTHGV